MWEELRDCLAYERLPLHSDTQAMLRKVQNPDQVRNLRSVAATGSCKAGSCTSCLLRAEAFCWSEGKENRQQLARSALRYLYECRKAEEALEISGTLNPLLVTTGTCVPYPIDEDPFSEEIAKYYYIIGKRKETKTGTPQFSLPTKQELRRSVLGRIKIDA